MKKQYESPQVSWILLESIDIITKSDNDGTFQDSWKDQIIFNG